MQDFRSFVIQWNNQFPLDKWWRDKYKIPFGSTAHLEMNQIDVFFEFVEQQVYSTQLAQVAELSVKEELVKKGEWLSYKEPEMTDEDFDKIVI